MTDSTLVEFQTSKSVVEVNGETTNIIRSSDTINTIEILENEDVSLVEVPATETTIIESGSQGPAGPPAEGTTYTNNTPTPSSLGGISSGSTFTDQTVQQMFDALLYPFQEPSFSSFTFGGRPALLEVGDSLSGGTKVFTWSINNPGNVATDSISISSTSGGVLASGLTDDGTENINIGSDITKTSMFTEVFTITGDKTTSGQISRTTSTSWRWYIFWGESENTTLTETEIEALTSSTLKNSRSGTYAVSSAGYKFIAWPTIFGTFNTFKDPETNQDIAVNLPETISVTNSFGVTQNYYLYRTTYYLNGALTMVVT